MTLPHRYLDCVQYGAPHTRNSEFSLRMAYVRYNGDNLDLAEKQAILSKCDFRSLNRQELGELRRADIIDNDVLLEAYDSALTHTEAAVEDESARAAKAEEERDEFRMRALRAEEAYEDHKSRFRLSLQSHMSLLCLELIHTCLMWTVYTSQRT